VSRLASRALSIAAVVCVPAVSPSGLLQTPARSPYVCDPTPVEDRLPELIAAMAGRSPVWLVDGDFGRWRGPDGWVKSAWVLSRTGAGSLEVRGRRLDAPGVVSFRQNMDEPPADVLRIPDPWGRRAMFPGGASTQIKKDYSFIGSLLMYPSPGCWELTATLGDDEVRIVRDLKKEP
jgi:hypothetical protein